MKPKRDARKEWAEWLAFYGAEKFYDAFMANAQDAGGRCVHCGAPIYLDIAEGGGIADWRTGGGDYGCEASPDTDEEGIGGHEPRRLRKEA